MLGLRKGVCVWAASVLFAFLAGNANAQQVFGKIFGTVTDASGGAINNAKVTVTDQSKGTTFEATTNESGNYERGQLIPGTYTVDVEAAGFQKSEFKDIAVKVDFAARVDATLQPGNVTQTVEVTAAAPTLQADRADVSTTFTTQELTSLPSVNRNAQAYVLLTPGTSIIGFAHASSEDPQGSKQVQVNGQHFSSMGYQLDGTENQDPILGIIVVNPNIDSLNENKISSQDYDAEFGYVAAGIQNASTKSGTNQFHFSAFEYFRNSSPGFTDFGRDPFSEPNGAPTLKYNQFGGSLGGRIVKDKLFFFADAELIRQRFGGSVLTTVPTALARTGNFSEYLAASPQNQIFDPTTGNQVTGVGRTAFPNNTIPMNRLSPQALAIQNYFPLPNAGSPSDPTLPNYAASGGGSFDANKWDTREDYFVNDKLTIFGRYSYQQFARSAVGAFGSLAGGPAFNNVAFAGNSYVRNQSIASGATYTFNPTVVNEFRFGYMRYHVQTTPNGVGTAPATAAGIPNLNRDAYYTSGLPYFSFRAANGNDEITSLGYALGGNAGQQCNCPLTQTEQQYQFTDNVSKIVRNHTFKFGADLRFANNLRVPSDSHRAGELRFKPQTTGFVSAPGANAVDGLSFATFLLGDVTEFARYLSSSTTAKESQRRWFFYGQDTWRVTPKLTINVGLRWEWVFPETVNQPGNGSILDLGTGLMNVFGVGTSQSAHGPQKMNWLNFAPRLGVAYQLNPKTVIRAGYGWAYSLGTFGANFGHTVTQNPPVLNPQQLTPANTFQDVFTLAQGPPFPLPYTVSPNGTFLLPNNVQARARTYDVRLPRVEAYNFTVERQIANNTSVSVGYVGNVGRHVGPGSGNGFDYNPNAPSFIPGLTNQNLAKPYFLRYGWTQSIIYECQCLNNQYNSLQVQLKRSFSAGLAVQASYTYQSPQGEDSDSYAILYNRPLAYGQQNYLPDQQLVISLSYDIPFGRGRKYGSNVSRWVDALVGGWGLSGITTFYTGLPFTPQINVYPAGTVRPYTGPSNRPDKGTGSPYASDKNRAHWLNVGPGGTLSSAFVVPANNTFGNYGRNTLRGPIFINQDLSAYKSFSLTERLKFQLRGEFYNLFNHANLGLPSGNSVTPNVNGNNAGVITNIAFGSTMRRLQFAARLDF